MKPSAAAAAFLQKLSRDDHGDMEDLWRGRTYVDMRAEKCWHVRQKMETED
jgi:hypothetical protein